jgi:hypothetical protein
MINKWERTILTKLVEIYEKRFHNGSNFKQSIRLNFTDKDFSFYTSPKSDNDVELIEIAVSKLEMSKFISVKKERYTNVLESVTLNLERISAIYKYLKKEEIAKTYSKFFEVLLDFEIDILFNYKEILYSKFESGKSIKSHLLDIKDMKDVCTTIDYLESNSADIYLRNLSVKLFKDSKRLESLISRIELVYKTVLDDFEDDFLLKKGVLKNPSYIFLKGKGKVVVNDIALDLTRLGGSIALSTEVIHNITFKEVASVLTIENLTTFNSYVGNELIIYLGGFSTSSQNTLLKRIQEANVEMIHWGDIDYGGYMILLNIYSNIGTLPKTRNMDLKTLKEYSISAKSIEGNNAYLGKIKSLLSYEVLNEYFDVIDYILSKKIILEQESIQS